MLTSEGRENGMITIICKKFPLLKALDITDLVKGIKLVGLANTKRAQVRTVNKTPISTLSRVQCYTEYLLGLYF